MKKVTLLGIACAAMLFSSCASYRSTASIMGVGGNNINTYVAADIDYNSAKKVEAQVNTKTILGFISLIKNGNKTLVSSNRYKGLTKAEGQALYRAKKNANVDIILDPEFETEKHSWFMGFYKTKSIKVTGWGVNMKGIKEDIHNVPNAEVSFPSNNIFK